MLIIKYNKQVAVQEHLVSFIPRHVGNNVVLKVYRKNQKGGYVASISYATLKEAIAHISGQEVKMIYLIGIDSNID